MSVEADLLIYNAGEMATLAEPRDRPHTGEQMRDLGIIRGGALAVTGERISAVGTVAEVRALVRRFKGMMSIETDGDDEEPDGEISLGDLEALQGVVKFPVRIKCATLAWNTLTEALDAPSPAA